MVLYNNRISSHKFIIIQSIGRLKQIHTEYLTQEVIKLKISKRIRDYRIFNKLTQKRLGEILNVSDKTISSQENRRTYPDISHIVILFEFLNVSLDTFLKEDKVMVRKFDRDLKLKNVYRYILFGGIAFYENGNWICYSPETVTYNGSKQYD